MLKTAGHQGAAAGQAEPELQNSLDQEQHGEGGNEGGSILQCTDPQSDGCSALEHIRKVTEQRSQSKCQSTSELLCRSPDSGF